MQNIHHKFKRGVCSGAAQAAGQAARRRFPFEGSFTKIPRMKLSALAPALATVLIFFSLAAADPQNLALNKPATASSQQTPDHLAAKANDGDPGTRWCASTGDVPQWWQVDLQKPCDLSGAEIRWEMNGKNYQYGIEGSTDAIHWQTLSNQSDTTSTAQTQTLSFKADGIRYVRVRIIGLPGGTWASIDEVKIFGQ